MDSLLEFGASEARQRLESGRSVPASVQEDMTTDQDVYTDRNLLAQLAAQLAERLGYRVWMGTDSKEPDWPVLFIELPTGQVSYHLPRSEIVIKLEPEAAPWDGHSTDEKWRRIRLYLEQARMQKY
jgi:hypothetical protein